MKLIPKPQHGEYPSYAEMYMKWMPDDGLLLQHLQTNFEHTSRLVQSLTEEQLYLRYAPNKWTIKEVLVHIVDDERIYAYRAMCFGRNEKLALPGFDQDEYARYSDANDRDIDQIMTEYEAVRNATIALFDGFSDTALTRMGVADGNRATVRALGYHIAGHELHHVHLLKTKYLNLQA